MGLLDYFDGSPSSGAVAGAPISTGGGIAMPTRKNYSPSATSPASMPAATTSGWQPTITPAPQSPQGGGGLFGSFGDSVNSALSNPAFQFGIGMAGAGGEGKGIGGGLFDGAQNAQQAWKMLQARRQQQMQNQRDSFAQSLNDPNNPIVKGLSPAAVAALKGVGADAAPDLLSSLLAHKGDLDNAKAVAGITADAQVRAKIAEMKYQRDMNMQMMHQFMTSGAAQPGISAPQSYPRPQSEADVQSLPPGTIWQAPDGSLRTR